MKVIVISRIRNESEIIIDTLNHISEYCDYAYIYDDNSTDNTVELCESHRIVKKVIKGQSWDTNRERSEFETRQKLIDLVMEDSNIEPNDWVIYLDADERLYFDNKILLDDNIGAVIMRLFDFYITKEDVNDKYYHRKFMGPEYREILFMYRKKYIDGYRIPDQRECLLKNTPNIVKHGEVKHYGKSISIQQWEDTCEYYSMFFPKYSKKWESRKGKAIHTKSDFGRDLITWNERFDKDKIVKI